MRRLDGGRRRVLDALTELEQVATHAQLRELGISSSTIGRRIGPDGPWQRLLPGVVLAHRGTPTRRERILGARAFAGPGSVVSGADALRASGVRGVELPATVLVLVPVTRRRDSFDYARLERTARPPSPTQRNGVTYAAPARALIDLCRFQESPGSIRATVASVVQQGLCTVPDLGQELREAPRQRTSGARLALAEVADGVRSIAEARARTLIRDSGLPAPRWNVDIRDADGVPILRPDAWWPHHRAALEIDSRRWHLSPEAWLRTQRRQRRLTAHGVLVMSFAPSEITDDPHGFIREVRALLTAARAEPA